MNSRSVNENNLVNFSVDLSKLNTLDTKDGLLSFPFDHIYACHSDSGQRQQTLQLDKEVEIATHCVIAENKELVVDESTTDVSRLTARLTATEKQNKRLKDLLIYHLDLIQQQNDQISKREKSYQTLKQENDNLKSRLNRMDRRVTVSQRHSVNPPPLVHVPPPPVTSTVVKSEPGSQIFLNSLTELILPSERTNPFIFESDANQNKSIAQDTFELPGSSVPDVSNYFTSDLSTSILENNISCENYTMIESKRNVPKKDFIKTETRSNPLYTVTTNSGHPVIQRVQRNRRRSSTGFGSLSRMPKTVTPTVKTEPVETKTFDDELNYGSFGLNKKTKMMNTYGKQRTTKCTSQFTGSLADRLQLIDTTPTGEDPYQLGEADMREQSPIPKLMLQKNNHRSRIGSSTSSLRAADPTTSKPNKKMERFNLSSTFVSSDTKQEPAKTVIVQEPDLDMVKTEPEIDWRIYDTNKDADSGLCDFNFGESSNLTSHISPALEGLDFQELFPNDSPLTLSGFADGFNPPAPMSVRRHARTTSLIGTTGTEEESTEVKRGGNAKRGRKRALSAAGVTKTTKPDPLPKVPPKPKLIKGKAACRGKKLPLPGLVTKKPYKTLVGDPDLTWYLGLDPDVKLEDLDPDPKEASKVSSVEVPRWREKPYTSCYTLEGTENLDDKVFEKRHQKLEAEERRQLRWHMRRVREQRHVERLRQRQRDPWGGSSVPTPYTVWPQPQKDVRFIEITKTLPVNAFGEILPALPPSDFMLPWVRTSKASKRSKRSKTLH